MSTTTTERLAGEFCPLCGDRGNRADPAIPFPVDYPMRVCDGYYVEDPEWTHAPILLSWPWESEEEYEAWYAEGDAYHEEEARAIGVDSFWARDTEYLAACAQRLAFLRAAVPLPWRPSVLDVGAGSGTFVVQMRALWEAKVLGLEPNASMVRHAAAMGRPVQQGTWSAVATQTPWCHLITLCDVLEHLTRPVECLETLRDALAPGGHLYVEMPEWAGDWTSRHIKPRQHICLYSRGAAEQLYERLGLVVVAFQRPCDAMIGKMAHVLKRQQP